MGNESKVSIDLDYTFSLEEMKKDIMMTTPLTVGEKLDLAHGVVTIDYIKSIANSLNDIRNPFEDPVKVFEEAKNIAISNVNRAKINSYTPYNPSPKQPNSFNTHYGFATLNKDILNQRSGAIIVDDFLNTLSSDNVTSHKSEGVDAGVDHVIDSGRSSGKTVTTHRLDSLVMDSLAPSEKEEFKSFIAIKNKLGVSLTKIFKAIKYGVVEKKFDIYYPNVELIYVGDKYALRCQTMSSGGHASTITTIFLDEFDKKCYINTELK